jgi:hypothetical protein
MARAAIHSYWPMSRASVTDRRLTSLVSTVNVIPAIALYLAHMHHILLPPELTAQPPSGPVTAGHDAVVSGAAALVLDQDPVGAQG